MPQATGQEEDRNEDNSALEDEVNEQQENDSIDGDISDYDDHNREHGEEEQSDDETIIDEEEEDEMQVDHEPVLPAPAVRRSTRSGRKVVNYLEDTQVNEPSTSGQVCSLCVHDSID